MRTVSQDPEHIDAPQEFGTFILGRIAWHQFLRGTEVEAEPCIRFEDGEWLHGLDDSGHTVLQTAPIYAVDAFKNGPRALEVLREFVQICLELHPEHDTPFRPPSRW